MFSLPQQLSSAAKSHIDTQLQLFSKISSTVLDGAEKVIALNLNAGKAALSHTAATAQHLLESQDAREFFRYGASQAKPNIDSLLAYGRQLYGIASSTHAELLASARARLDAASIPSDIAAPAQIKALAAPASAPAPAPAAAAPVIAPAPPAAPVVVAAPPAAEPAAVAAAVLEEAAQAPLPLAASAPVAPAEEPVKLAVPEAAVLAAAEAADLPVSRIKVQASKTGPAPVAKGGKKK